MKKVVVDTNILFSALLHAPNTFANIIFEENIAFYTPHFVIVELFKHKERIMNKECRISKARHVQFDIPCSIFDIRYFFHSLFIIRY